MKETDFASVLAERREIVCAELASIFRPPDPAAAAASQSDAGGGGTNAGAIAPAPADFVWEVGCGHGHFLTAYAAAHPTRVCIGVDIASDRIARARKKAERARLRSLHFLRTEASLFLEAMPASVRITAVFVLFPDPWPKLRHHKHRVLQPEFLEDLAHRAAPRCRLHFRTDFEPYFREARAVAEAASAWQLVDAPWPFEFETVFQSRAAEGYHSFIAELRAPGGA
jgi:tRNA (guanine-N7-)-methyltransferase